MKAKQIVIVGYDDVMGLDLVGPLEAFGSARVNTGPGKAEEAYRVTVAALGAKTFRSEFGLAFTTLFWCPAGVECAAPTTRKSSQHGCGEMQAPCGGSRRCAREFTGWRRRDC